MKGGSPPLSLDAWSGIKKSSSFLRQWLSIVLGWTECGCTWMKRRAQQQLLKTTVMTSKRHFFPPPRFLSEKDTTSLANYHFYRNMSMSTPFVEREKHTHLHASVTSCCYCTTWTDLVTTLTTFTEHGKENTIYLSVITATFRLEEGWCMWVCDWVCVTGYVTGCDWV